MEALELKRRRAEAVARAKAAEAEAAAQAEQGPATPENQSFVDNFTQNAMGIGSGLWNTVRHPLDTLQGIDDVVSGGAEAATRYLSPETAKKMDEMRNWVADKSGGYLAENRPVGVNSPGAEAAITMAGNMYNSGRHPIQSFHDRPIDTVLDWLTLVGGVVAKVPKVASVVKGAQTAEDILKAANDAKKTAVAGVKAYPNKVNLPDYGNAARTAAHDEGYMNAPITSENHVAVNSIAKDFYPGPGSLQDLWNMRKSANMTTKAGTTAPILKTQPNGISKAMKEAIDTTLAAKDPLAHQTLGEALAAIRKEKQTEELLNLHKTAAASAIVSPSGARAVARDIKKVILNPEKTRGLGDTVTSQITDVLDHVRPPGKLETMRNSLVEALPIAGGIAAGSTPIGVAGYPFGYTAGKVAEGGLKGAKAGKTARVMADELLAIASELNGLPRGSKAWKIRMAQLTPKQRAILLATMPAQGEVASH